MKNKAFIIVVLTIIVSWFVVTLFQMRMRHKIAMTHHREISVLTDEIGTLKATIEGRAGETVSRHDLQDALEVVRLEGEIRDLRMENALARAEGKPRVYPEFVPILFLAFLSIQVAMLDRKLK